MKSTQRSFLILLLLSGLSASALSEKPHFSFHLMAEPTAFDPARGQGAASGYLYSNLFHGLYRYHPTRGLEPQSAESCSEIKLNKKPNQLNCRLKPLLWSNGEKIKAMHYVLAFQRLIDPNTKSIQAEYLLALENAPAILAGKLKPTQLGVKALDDFTLVFSFEKPDPEFKYKLILPSLGPVYQWPFPAKPEDIVTNGPYKIKHYRKGHLLELTPNPHFKDASELPPVDIYFVDDDSAALNLYLSGKLKFLRRLVTDKIEKFRTRPDFHQVALARFDYIGFGKRFKNQEPLRRQFAASLKYNELASLYRALGVPGCPSLPKKLQDRVYCHEFKSSEPFTQAQLESLRGLTLAYSKMGGEDIQKGMEWVQDQWRKHLGVKVELQPQEQALYLERLKVNPFDFFRKGVALDRPTCLAALEIFTPGNPENYIEMNDPQFNKLVSQLSSATSEATSRKICSEAIHLLIKQAYIIPLGEMHFTILAAPKFTGWSLNEMNQLDLSQLRVSN